MKANADNAKQTDRLAGEARQQAERSVAIATRTTGAMNEIKQSSRKIEDIIGVIDEIAFQLQQTCPRPGKSERRAGAVCYFTA